MANASKSSYQIENIAFPDDMPPEIGGLAIDKKGNLYACLRRGDVLVTKPNKDAASPPSGKYLPQVYITLWEWS